MHNGAVIRKHAVVHGLVQGVGFRYSARVQASRLGLSGFARNRPDGAVEVEIEGDDAAVARMLTWLAAGPRSAVVKSVEISDQTPTGETGFWIAS